MEKRLAGKVVVVTGGTKGVGRGIALAAGKEGASVVIGGRNEEEGASAVKELNASGAKALFVPGDLKEVENCRRLISEAESAFGKIDGLVNNAGIATRTILEEVEEKMFDDIFALNIKAAFFCTKYAVRAMIRGGGGSIVNVGSVHAFDSVKGTPVYSCSKGALYSLTKHVAEHYGKDRIRANWLGVGWVLTPGEMEMRRKADQGMEWLQERVEAITVLGSFQTNEDIALAAIYLLSDESSQVTKVDLNVTGGLTNLKTPRNK